MLTTKCINPELMAALALCGHGSQILIADGNYPLNEKSGSATKIFLGLCPGTPTVTAVLATLQSVINIEAATVMQPADGTGLAIFDEFRQMLPGIELKKLGRFEFYDACSADKAVVIAIETGERRTYANLLITVACA